MGSGETTSLPTFHSWVGGREVEGRGGLRPAVDPATGVAFGQASLLDGAQAADAVAAAQAAFPAWSRTSFRERARLLDRLREAIVDEADDLARLIEREQGKPFAEALAAEVLPSLDALQHLSAHAEDLLRDDAVEAAQLLLAHKQARIVYEPIGVVLAVKPWNYPWGSHSRWWPRRSWPGTPSCSSPPRRRRSPACGSARSRRRRASRTASWASWPPTTPSRRAWSRTHGSGKIVFTGSVATGKKVMAAAAKNLTPVLLELGGKDPAIVCRDADLDRAAKGIVWAAFMNAGQTCASVERVYVEKEVKDAFLAKVLEETRGLRRSERGEAARWARSPSSGSDGRSRSTWQTRWRRAPAR